MNNMAAKRVGSVTLGLTLVTFGVMFLLSAFIKSFNYLDVIKFWPVIFISLGIEMLVHAFSKDAEKAKLDVPSCLMTCVLMLFSMCLAGAQYAITELIPYLETRA
jgi:steroid 5-alpha reductase family enzyme